MNTSNTARTNRLLILCARTRPGSRSAEEIGRLLRRGPDWESVIARAEQEGVLPLLYRNVGTRHADVPADVLERLKAGYLRNLARNAQAAARLRPFLEGVGRSQARVMLTKGLRLALSVYPDIGLRPFWDIDFIVHPSDWPDVRRILDGLGFEELSSAAGGPGPTGPGRGWGYSPYFRRAELVLEFHFNVLGLAFPVNMDECFAGARCLPVRGAEVPVLSPELEFCHVCLHAQQHSFQRLVWLTDIAEMASRGDLDWDQVYGLCERLRIGASVYHGLKLAEALWPGTAAPAVLRKLRPGALPVLALGFFWPEASVAAREISLPWPYDMPSLFSLWERRSAGLAWRTLGAVLFPPRAWLARSTGVSENSALVYYQYLRRLARPVGLAARRIWKAR
jgi:hypothetical protein